MHVTCASDLLVRAELEPRQLVEIGEITPQLRARLEGTELSGDVRPDERLAHAEVAAERRHEAGAESVRGSAGRRGGLVVKCPIVELRVVELPSGKDEQRRRPLARRHGDLEPCGISVRSPCDLRRPMGAYGISVRARCDLRRRHRRAFCLRALRLRLPTVTAAAAGDGRARVVVVRHGGLEIVSRRPVNENGGAGGHGRVHSTNCEAVRCEWWRGERRVGGRRVGGRCEGPVLRTVRWRRCQAAR